MLDICEKMPGGEGIQRYIFFEIELAVIRIDAEIIVALASIRRDVLGKESRRTATDELRALFEDISPQTLIERRVVDLANKVAQTLRIGPLS